MRRCTEFLQILATMVKLKTWQLMVVVMEVESIFLILSEKQKIVQSTTVHVAVYVGNACLQPQPKTAFEGLLKQLKEKEGKSFGLREEVATLLENIDIAFTTDYDKYSKKYSPQEAVSETAFNVMFSKGKTRNISVCLQSSQQYKNVKVSSNIHVANLRITSAGNGVQYLRILPQTEDTRIVFEDCRFGGVGLVVWSGDDTVKKGSVLVINCEVKNAPVHGIFVDSCNDGKIENVVIDGCCDGSGIYFLDTVGEIKNSTISNCSKYGVLSDNDTVKGHQVQFINNKEGNTNGNYVGV
eukprot:TRINITY_DN29299_c2_g1_i1.p1 TRINITY_DN29299_c2_g1~~TRINITY_DN29299_c2_g1_i1.p1  ORF type:complete len:297 (+),score=34.87 TRINITY_DN29299_c2_g1_i1:532-1422(+)